MADSPPLDGYLPDKLSDLYGRDPQFRELMQAAFDFDLPIVDALVNVILTWDEDRCRE